MTGLCNDVASIIVHSQDYPFNIEVDNLMHSWEVAKQPFINKFGGKLIVRTEQPIKVYLSQEQQVRKFNEFIQALNENGILTKELEDFLLENQQGFFDNTVIAPYPPLDIKPGAKLSKSLKRFISVKSTVRWAQDVASRFMQENKIEGYLYLSVDPRDYLTLSENNMNWTSCHSLDGDFRTGNLSYMVDKTTVVAYIASEKQEHLKCLPGDMEWYNKKWRMVVHLDPENLNCIYFNRQYPFSSGELVNRTFIELSQVMGIEMQGFTRPSGFYSLKKFECGSGEQSVFDINQMTAGYRVFSSKDIIDVSDYHGYCDLISSSTYTPVVSARLKALEEYFDVAWKSTSTIMEEFEAFKKVFGIKIGGQVLCPRCGKPVTRDDKFLCNDCIAELDADEDFFLTCHSCYHRIYDEDEVYWIDNRPYCKECYQAIQREDTIEEDV